MLDQVQNFIKEAVTGTHTAVATTINVNNASNFPNPASGEYNLTWYDSTLYPDPSDDPSKEIVRVTAYDTGLDTLTVTRAQEGTTGTVKNTSGSSYNLLLAPTKKTVDDIENLVRDIKFRLITSTTTLTNNANTKVIFSTEAYDTGSNVASSRFTAPVDGYYHFDSILTCTTMSGANAQLGPSIFVNGSAAQRGGKIVNSGSTVTEFAMTTSSDLYLTSGDYVEVYVYLASDGNESLFSGTYNNTFSGHFIGN